MKNSLLFVVCVVVVGLAFLGGCAQEKRPTKFLHQYLTFDQKEVTHTVTPDTDTLYFGFHGQDPEVIDDQYDYVYQKKLLHIDRWSTAKFKRDFTVADSLMYLRGFWAICNLTRYTGEFYIIVCPEKITQPCFIKLYVNDSPNSADSMIINLIPPFETQNN